MKKTGVFFIYGYDGTRKVFIWRVMSTAFIPKEEIILTVYLSGIPALLISIGVLSLNNTINKGLI